MMKERDSKPIYQRAFTEHPVPPYQRLILNAETNIEEVPILVDQVELNALRTE